MRAPGGSVLVGTDGTVVVGVGPAGTVVVGERGGPTAVTGVADTGPEPVGATVPDGVVVLRSPDGGAGAVDGGATGGATVDLGSTIVVVGSAGDADGPPSVATYTGSST
jgi:hypothetical protein